MPQADGQYVIEQYCHFSSSGFWGSFDYQGKLNETHAPSGMLIKSGNNVKEDDERYWTQIKLSGDEYMAFKSQMKSDQEKEDEEAIDLAAGAIAHLVPGAGNIMMISELLMPDGKQEQISKRFTKDSFDTSFLNLPYFWKNNGYKFPSSLRVFDSDELIVYSATISSKGKEVIENDGMVIQANHYTLHVNDDMTTEIWLARSENHVPYFVQITGLDDGLIYKIAYKSNKPKD
jgi:hypothetical protein